MFSELQCFDSKIPILEGDNLGRRIDFESNDTSKVSVKGRLRQSISQWRKINTPQFILDIIEFGYKLPFLTMPPPKVLRNNRSALNESSFEEDSIKSLSELDCVVELPEAPELINPLSVFCK